jgi:hypothetical protein
MILAIDPGNTESGYVIMLDDYTICSFGKIPNDELLNKIDKIGFKDIKVVIEMVASYGMSVGQTIFDTCVWIGRFKQASLTKGREVTLVYRKDVKMNLCGQTRAKDSNIIQALIDRFAYDVPNRGKGYKKSQGYFYGFKADIWQAYALGVTYIDSLMNL